VTGYLTVPDMPKVAWVAAVNAMASIAYLGPASPPSDALRAVRTRDGKSPQSS
jgi:hypothetical protein